MPKHQRRHPRQRGTCKDAYRCTPHPHSQDHKDHHIYRATRTTRLRPPARAAKAHRRGRDSLMMMGRTRLEPAAPEASVLTAAPPCRPFWYDETDSIEPSVPMKCCIHNCFATGRCSSSTPPLLESFIAGPCFCGHTHL